MNQLKARTLFLREAFRDIHEVGSIIPSSNATGQAMTAAFRQRTAPARVLEAGAGTGPITAHIVRDMRDGDRLDAYEINEEYAQFLQNRFETEPDYRRVADQCAVFADPVEQIEEEAVYDYIITAIPHTALPVELVQTFFEKYEQLLKPGGVLTYIEFAFTRNLMKTFTLDRTNRARLNQIDEVVSSYVDEHQINHQFVLRNAPPARIRSLQF